MSPPTDLVLRGRITFEEAAPPFRDATAFVRLEDVTMADASARVVAEQVIHGVSNPPADGHIPFAVRPGPVDERARYNVRVLVDLDGDGAVGEGDYITVESYPVLSRGHPAQATVRVHRV